MWLLPYQRVTLRTQLPAEVVLQRLAANVEPARWLRNPFSRDAHKQYEGAITADAFKLMRIIRGRNSFLPVVVGRVRSDGLVTVLEATQRLHHAVAGFMVFWLGSLAFFGTRDLMRRWSLGKDPWALLPAAGMLAFGYLLMQLSFLAEAKRATRFLEEVTREGGA